MATKNLARTVIEGGRHRQNKKQRYFAQATERARVRSWLAHTDGDDAPAPRPKVYRSFDDKLAPAMRWLRAQVGRAWDAVYSDLHARFDTRTTAGRHIIHDHLLRDVQRGRELFVDPHGILRRETRSWRQLRAEVDARVRDRRAVLTYRGWWWWRLDGDRCRDYRCARPHALVDHQRWHATHWLWDAPLTRGELRWLDNLPAEWRRGILLP